MLIKFVVVRFDDDGIQISGVVLQLPAGSTEGISLFVFSLPFVGVFVNFALFLCVALGNTESHGLPAQSGTDQPTCAAIG